MHNPIIKQVQKMTDEVIVAFSGGKDSLATLDLCARNFKRVEAYHCYMIEGLEFVEKTVRWAEQKYGIKILRMPSYPYSQMLTMAMYRRHTKATEDVKPLSQQEVDAHARMHFQIKWIAKGLKKVDNLLRRGFLSKHAGIDFKNSNFYPITDWDHNAVFAYMQSQRIPVPASYMMIDRSFVRMNYESLAQIKKNHPDDYRKIIAVFPFAEVELKRFEMYGKEDSSRHKTFKDRSQFYRRDKV